MAEYKCMTTQHLAWEDEEDEKEEENVAYEEEGEDVFPKEERTNLVLRRALRNVVKNEEVPEQRESIFVTKCKIQGKLCDLIIDGGSETNTISNEVVTQLGLPTTRHPRPYKLSWLDKTKSTGVRKQCLVSFSIGPYEDKVLCDVISMDACHVLLGRPWQSDRRSFHNGVANTYQITHEGRKLTLHPLPPPKTPQAPQKTPNTNLPETKSKPFLLTYKEFEDKIDDVDEIYLLCSKESIEAVTKTNPKLGELIQAFEDVLMSSIT